MNKIKRAFFPVGLALLLVPLGVRAECPVPELPNSFSVKQNLISLPRTFSVGSEWRDFGQVRKKKLISFLTPEYTWLDFNGNKLARAKKSILSWGAKIDVFDCEDQKIGTIKVKVLKSLFRVRTVASILDAEGEEIASSTKFELFTTSIAVNDNDKDLVATLNRPLLRISDRWDMEIANHDAVDSRVLVMLGVFQTDRDAVKRVRRAQAININQR
ncbi:MAG: hypothetical protein OXB88_00250 [Bacteriovoracales bacterium]|nr:hypothetical protein [Bacteriovoracales bacterium]